MSGSRSLASCSSTALGMPYGLSTGGRRRFAVLRKCLRCFSVMRVRALPPHATMPPSVPSKAREEKSAWLPAWGSRGARQSWPSAHATPWSEKVGGGAAGWSLRRTAAVSQQSRCVSYLRACALLCDHWKSCSTRTPTDGAAHDIPGHTHPTITVRIGNGSHDSPRISMVNSPCASTIGGENSDRPRAHRRRGLNRL